MWRNRLHQFLMLILLWLAYGSSYLVRKPLGLIKADLMKELGVGSDLLGWLDVSLFLPYAGVSLSMGWLAEIMGARTVFGVGLVVSGACAVGIGQCYSLGMICLLLFGVGASQALCWPSAVSILTKWYRESEHNYVFGVFGTSSFVGSVASTYFAVYLQKSFGWRAIFVPCGLIPVVTGLLVAILARSPHGYGVNIPGIQERDIKCHESPKSDEAGIEPTSKLSFIEIMRFKQIPEVCTSIFCCKFVRYAIMMWLPLFLKDTLHYSTVGAGVGSTAYDIGGIVGSLFNGFLVRLFFRNDNLFGAFMVNIISGFFMLLFLFSQNLGTSYHMVLLFMAGLFNCAGDLLLTGPIASSIGAKHNAVLAVGGVVNGMGSVGAVVQGPVMGWVAASFGWLSVLPMLIILSCVGGLAAYRAYRFGAVHLTARI